MKNTSAKFFETMETLVNLTVQTHGHIVETLADNLNGASVKTLLKTEEIRIVTAVKTSVETYVQKDLL